MQITDFLKTKTGLLAGGIFSTFLLGSAFPAIKIAYSLFQIESSQWPDQILLGGIRFTIAGIMLLLYVCIVSKKVPVLPQGVLPCIIEIGMLHTVGQYVLFNIGVAHTSGVKSSIIFAVNGCVTLLISCLIFRQERLTAHKIAACLIGFLGIVLVNLNSGVFDFSMRIVGEGFIFLASVSYGFASGFMKKHSKTYDPIFLAGSQFTFGGIIMTAIGLLSGGQIIANVPIKGVILLLYLSFVSAASYAVWSNLLKYHPISKVSVLGILNPLIGALLSAVFLKEWSYLLRINSILALVLVCFSIWYVNQPAVQKSQKT